MKLPLYLVCSLYFLFNGSEVLAQTLSADFTIAEDGAWTWFNDERAVIRDGRLYTSYVKSTGHTALSTYDIWLNRPIGEEVHLSTWTEFDDHNNASLLFNSEGKLMAFYAKHHTNKFTNLRTALVERPERLSDWGEEMTVQSGANHTYNNAFQLSELNNTIFNFSRTNGYNPNWKKYNADGTALTADVQFIKSGDDKTRPYVKYASNNRNRIEFFFTNGHPRKTDNNLYHMYYENAALYQTDGTFIKNESDLPVLVEEVDPLYTFGDFSPTARPWTCSFNYSEEGRPVVTYSLQEDMNTIDYYYAYWNDSTWVHHYVADAGDALYDRERDYTGLLVINPYDVDEVFMSTNINPISGSETPHYEIYRGRTNNNGKSFEWSPITMNSEDDNLRPFVPKGASDENQVLLWFKGTYRTYQDFTTSIVGKYIGRSLAGRYNDQRYYSSNGGNWNFEQPELWTVEDDVLSLNKPGEFLQPFRRPTAIATLATAEKLESFNLTAKIKCTNPVDNKGRDVIMVFGYQSPSKFYYAHLCNDNSMLPHNGIFIVDGSDRRRIDDQGLANPPETRMNDQTWHDIKVKRNVETGQIAIFLDDMVVPLMTATDHTFTSGDVGFGSFDNTGEIKNLNIYSGEASFLVIDDFNDFKNGNINGQGEWIAGPPGATDGGRVTSLIPEGMSGRVLENNANGVQFRGNAIRDLEISSHESFTLYFEMASEAISKSDFLIALNSNGSIQLEDEQFDLRSSVGFHFNRGRLHSILNNEFSKEVIGLLVNEEVFQFWINYNGLDKKATVYFNKMGSKDPPVKKSLGEVAWKNSEWAFKKLLIYNNPNDIPTANSYIDNIFISKGKNITVPEVDLSGTSGSSSDVIPITNPFEETIPEGDLKLQMVEFATIPASDEMGNVRARINNLTYAPDGTDRLWVNDLRGHLYVLKNGAPTVYMSFPERFPYFVDTPRQNSGLGYVAFHPDFLTNGLFYTSHTEGGKVLQDSTADFKTGLKAKAHAVITEWKADDPLADTFKGSHREVLRIGFSTFLHGIQAINFNPTADKGDDDFGLLYIAMGDGEENPNQTTRALSRATHEAKIFRIDPLGNNSRNSRYGIPSSNPFINDVNALGEIYCMGIRNPHRMAWDTQTGKMYIAMIGENQIDAIYEGIKGANYGWNIREGAFVFDRSNPMYVATLPENDSINNFTYPIVQLDHDDTKAAIVAGVYRGNAIPSLKGKLLFGDIVFGQIYYIDEADLNKANTHPLIRQAQIFNEEGEKTSFVKEVSHYYRADLKFGEDATGEIYLLSKTNGKIYRLKEF